MIRAAFDSGARRRDFPYSYSLRANADIIRFGMLDLTISLQALVAASIFFVWVIRYDNTIQEFKQYGLPGWLRDLVGILKLTFR